MTSRLTNWLSKRTEAEPTTKRRHNSALLRAEQLEDRAVPSQTSVPLDVYTIHGTYINESNPLGVAFGSGRDTGEVEMGRVARTAAHALSAINPKAKVVNVTWASFGDRGTPAHGIADDLRKSLAARTGSHDVLVITYSASAFVGDKLAKEISQFSNVRRVLVVNLDPTGNKLLDHGDLNPVENKKVHNITYYDGLSPFGSFFVTQDTLLPGFNQKVYPLGHPTSDGLKSHNGFPNWYVNSGQLVRDLLGFEQASSAETTAAKRAAASPLMDHPFRTFPAPGHGENLLLPLIEHALQAGIDTITDDLGHTVQTVVDHPGHLLIAAIDVNGVILGSVYDQAGNLVKNVTGTLSHWGQHVIDFFNPFGW